MLNLNFIILLTFFFGGGGDFSILNLARQICLCKFLFSKLKLKWLYFTKPNFSIYGLQCILASQTEFSIDSQVVALLIFSTSQLHKQAYCNLKVILNSL